MTTFYEATSVQCMTPISGNGPDMIVCGAPAIQGRRCCEKCRSVLYVPPKGLAWAARPKGPKDRTLMRKGTVLHAEFDRLML